MSITLKGNQKVAILTGKSNTVTIGIMVIGINPLKSNGEINCHYKNRIIYLALRNRPEVYVNRLKEVVEDLIEEAARNKKSIIVCERGLKHFATDQGFDDKVKIEEFKRDVLEENGINK